LLGILILFLEKKRKNGVQRFHFVDRVHTEHFFFFFVPIQNGGRLTTKILIVVILCTSRDDIWTSK
jgi:hypothetical protein